MTDAAAYQSWQNGAMPSDVPWETVTTKDKVIVIDGKLTIGAQSTHDFYSLEEEKYITDADLAPDYSEGGRRGSFWMTNFILNYYGPATEDQITAAVSTLEQKAATINEGMHFAADKATMADSLALYQTTKSIDLLNKAIALGETSENKYTEIMGEGKTIPTVTDSLANEEGEAYGAAKEIVAYALTKTNEWISSEAATYAKVDSILNVMKGYSATYSKAYTDAAKAMVEMTSTSAKSVLTDIMTSQKAELIAGTLLVPSAVDSLVTDLNYVLATAQAQEQYEKNKDATDFTSYIKNADGSNAEGWTVISKGNGPTNSKEYFDSNKSDRVYFDSWAGSDLNFTVEQVINNLPNGTYTVKAAVRTAQTEEEGVAFFTANGGEAKTDTTYYAVPNQWKHLGAVARADETINEDSVVFCSNIYGAMWEEANIVCAETYSEATEEQQGIWNANGGKGFGWQWKEITGVEVLDHKLVIGFTSDSNRTGKKFSGQWFSVADFSLTLTEKGDNTGWDGPITGINETPVEKKANAIDGIYTLSGARVASPRRGLYIVVKNGKSSKVVIK